METAMMIQMGNDDGSDNGDDTNQTYTRFAFVELPKPKISCSECPKIAAMVDELYDSGDYPFYYVTLPEENKKGACTHYRIQRLGISNDLY